MTKHKFRFSFIVETEEKPQEIFRKIWDIMQENVDPDVFGYYQCIFSFEEMTKILLAVKGLVDSEEIKKAIDSVIIRDYKELTPKERRNLRREKRKEIEKGEIHD